MNGGITTSVNFWYKVSMSFSPKQWGWGEVLQCGKVEDACRLA